MLRILLITNKDYTENVLFQWNISKSISDHDECLEKFKLPYLKDDDKDPFENNLTESELHLAFLKELKNFKFLLGRIKMFFFINSCQKVHVFCFIRSSVAKDWDWKIPKN